jgi:hypothetical protein
VAQAPPQTISKTLPEIHQQKHIEKSHWKTTPNNKWCKHCQKQHQKHYPKSNNKNTLKNRIEKPHRKMSDASTTENNLKNTARNPQMKTHWKIALTNRTEKWVVQAPPKTTSKTLPEVHQQKTH